MEKLAFALVTETRKLKPYFQAHTVVVLTDKPLRRAMSTPEVAGQMALWAIKLSKFDVQYRPCTTMKGKIVTDFIVKFTSMEGQGVGECPQWSINTDESFNRQAGGAGVVLHSLEGDEIECKVHLNFEGKSGFVSHTKLTTEATFMDLFHS